MAELDAMVEEELALETGAPPAAPPAAPVAPSIVAADEDLFVEQALAFLGGRDDARALLARIGSGLPPVSTEVSHDPDP